MTTKARSKSTAEKARQVLDFARRAAKEGRDSAQLFLAVFGSQGKAALMFPTSAEWTAFEQTDEWQAIRNLIDSAPAPSAREESHAAANGTASLVLRLPKSVHAALVAEAAAEGVSLDQLCLSKLVAQLRELV